MAQMHRTGLEPGKCGDREGCEFSYAVFWAGIGGHRANEPKCLVIVFACDMRVGLYLAAFALCSALFVLVAVDISPNSCYENAELPNERGHKSPALL